MNDELKYSIEVYEGYALIKGWIPAKTFNLLIKLCQQEGFTHLTQNGTASGFRLIRMEIKE